MAGSISETVAYLTGEPPTANGLQFARYTTVALSTLYLYDILLTLDVEVALIWSHISFNLLNVLYITNRYVGYVFFVIIMYNLPGFHSDLSDAYCKIPMDLVGIFIAYAAWTGIMNIRVCAIYRQKWRLVMVLRLLWAGAMGALFASLFLTYKESAPRAYSAETLLCLITSNSNTMKTIPIGPAVYEIILTFLTVLKSFDFSDDASDTTLPFVYRVLAREGMAYFMISMMITLIIMIYWYLFPGSSVLLLLLCYWGVMSPLLARLVLRLKTAHQVNLSEQGASGDATASIPFFRSPGQHPFRGHVHGGRGSGRFSTAKSSFVDTPIHSDTRMAQSEEDDQGWNSPRSHAFERRHPTWIVHS